MRLYISKEDERVKSILDDPYCPESLIQGVCVIYKLVVQSENSYCGLSRQRLRY